MSFDEQKEKELNNKYINTNIINNLTKKIIGQSKEEKKALSPGGAPGKSSYDTKENKKKETKVINSLSEKEEDINNNKYIIEKEEKKER